MNKVLGAVIAVIGLALLFYGVWRLYDHTVSGQESEQAKALINKIEERIEVLEEGQNSSFLINGMERWYLVGWSKTDENRPEKCYFENCICICPGKESSDCQDNGFCRFFDYEVNTGGYFVCSDFRITETEYEPIYPCEWVFFSGDSMSLDFTTNELIVRRKKDRANVMLSEGEYGRIGVGSPESGWRILSPLE